MKKLLYITTIILAASAAEAQNSVSMTVDGVSVGNAELNHYGDKMAVDLRLGLKDLQVKSNRAVLLTPRLINGNDSVSLPSVGIYGRSRYYFYVRNGESMLSGKNEASYMASKKPDEYEYHYSLPYQDWMNGAELTVRRSDYGCCNRLLARQEFGSTFHFTEEMETASMDMVFFPELVYVQPEAENEKIRSLRGSAFIDFPVNKTVIYPDYRRNTSELATIQATIDSVRNDKDVNITKVWLKGFASPESPYSHNASLAIGRTAALKDYIRQLYKFDDGIIVTDYEPEDWAGLKKYVEESNINHKYDILGIIDSPMDPDAKELKIKKTYPAEYRFLLQNVYPGLRHTDYRIEYNVRSYNDPLEIRDIMSKSPQKLSLNEFYLVASLYQPGTEEFADVYDTAVRMFPEDETANLNAANAAIRSDNFAAAERYLAKAGKSAEAEYARGALAIRMGDIPKARLYLQRAKNLGLRQASVTLESLDNNNE